MLSEVGPQQQATSHLYLDCIDTTDKRLAAMHVLPMGTAYGQCVPDNLSLPMPICHDIYLIAPKLLPFYTPILLTYIC